LIRNVSDDRRRKLKARAAAAGMSLSDYALTERRKSAEQLTMQETVAPLATRERLHEDIDIAAIVREERETR
jgi:plasmid stability protein